MEGLTSLLLGASVALIVYHVANAIRPRRKQVVESPVPAVRCTLRVREIRSSVSREALLRSLLEIGKHDAQDGPSPQVESHIVRWSFTRSAHVRHAASSFVATVCLSQLSARLRKEIGLNGRSPVDIRLGIQIEGNLHRVLVDDHFHGLTPLYWHPDWGIDIVAVTGWNGKAFMSWKPENSEEMWLRDWLGDDLARQNCHARIFTYGYPSKLADSTTDATLYDYGQGLLRAIKTARYNQLQGSATRPLILIGHSLGGLLIRQALKDACSSQHAADRDIYESCISLVMFGVPNLGLDNAALLTMTMGQKNEAFARDLGENSQYLQELKRSFSLAIRNRPIRIIAIYELEDSRSVIKTNGRWARTGPMIRMVSRKSACDCGESAETLVTLESHTNHSGLVKFATPEDLIYQALLVQLVDIAHSVPSSYHISVQTYAELPSFVQSAKEISVPDDLESSFKGRDEILGDIHASLSANIGSQVFVLHGIGGIGKTQIALKYLSQHSQKYSKVVWVNAESEKRLQESFRTVAASLGVENTEEDLAGQVYFALAHLDEVLMIYDNLDDPSLFEVIKDGHRARWKQPFRILITTRDRTFLDLSTEDRGVEALDPDHAVDMLLNFLGVGPKPSSDMRRDASAICEAVGYLPLAIKHAASYMKVYGVPPQVYIKQLEQEPRQILEYSSAWLPYKRSVVNVCEDIMARIEKNTYATNWLYLCSFLNTSIPHDLFELAHSWWQRLLHNPQGMDTAVQHQIQWLYATPAQASWTMALMIDNIRDLHRLSLVKITRQQNGTVTSALHPLTQQWVRLRLEPQDQRRYMIMASSLIHACAEELRMSHETEQFSTAAYSTHRWLIPQAYSCIAFAENVLKQNIAEVIPVASAITMATFYMDEQKYPQALSLLEIASRKHGSHDDEINTQRAMALVLRRLRRPEEAKRVQEGIIRKLRETVDMPEWKILQVLEAAAELATIFRDLGDLDKALELQAEIVVEMQRLTGDKSLKTLHEMSCLARIHSKRCEFEKALEIEKAVLGAYRRMHSKRPEILDKMRNLAVTRYEMGDFGAAIELEEEVLKGAEGLYGPDNLVTASAMQNLATSYRRVARPGEALALYSKALGIRRQVLGEAHRATQKTARYMRLTKGIVQAAAKDADGITGLASRVDSGLGLE